MGLSGVYRRVCVLRKKQCLFLLLVLTVLPAVLHLLKGLAKLTVTVYKPSLPGKHPRPSAVPGVHTECNSVFPGMLRGHWVPKRNVSEGMRRQMDEYLHSTRGEYKIPRTLQRRDGKCGNLPYDGVPLYRHMWFRALCDPSGHTPCCKDFRCTNHSAEECTCRFCLDSRSPVHAELSDWLPEEAACRPREWVTSEACSVLKGTTVVLAGDSFVRHMFVALVMLLTGNFQNGALKKNAPSYVLRQCQGMFQINGLRCRDILDEDRSLCGGTVRATYLEIFQVSRGGFLLPRLQKLASQNRRLLVLVGLGIHDDFRADLIWPFFLQPVVAFFTNTAPLSFNATSDLLNVGSLFSWNSSAFVSTGNFSERPAEQGSVDSSDMTEAVVNSSSDRTWPKMVWLSTHAPGLLKSPRFLAQSYDGVRHYNNVVANLLKPYGIPVLDSFNMTAPLHSVDGTHYGYGANALKVHFLLHWVKERQDRGEW